MHRLAAPGAVVHGPLVYIHPHEGVSPVVADAPITLTVQGNQVGGRSACNHYGGEIIVGIVDSPSARATLRWAAAYARSTETALRAIHVVD